MTYRFDNYETPVGTLNGEFIDPIIDVNKDSIVISDIKKTLSCELKLITPNGSSFGTMFLDMPRNGTGWDDSDLDLMVVDKLNEFKVS
jgi:hypothetical protein